MVLSLMPRRRPMEDSLSDLQSSMVEEDPEELTDAELEILHKITEDVQKLNQRLARMEAAYKASAIEEKLEQIIERLKEMMPPKPESEGLQIAKAVPSSQPESEEFQISNVRCEKKLMQESITVASSSSLIRSSRIDVAAASYLDKSKIAVTVERPKVTSEIPSSYCPSDLLLKKSEFVNQQSVVENPFNVVSMISIDYTPTVRQIACEDRNLVLWEKKPLPKPPDRTLQALKTYVVDFVKLGDELDNIRSSNGVLQIVHYAEHQQTHRRHEVEEDMLLVLAHQICKAGHYKNALENELDHHGDNKMFKEMEEFLFQMLGCGFQCDKNAIQGILEQCRYVVMGMKTLAVAQKKLNVEMLKVDPLVKKEKLAKKNTGAPKHPPTKDKLD